MLMIWQIDHSDRFSLQFHPLDLDDPNTILVGSVLLDQIYSVFEYADDPTAPYGLTGAGVTLYRRR